ncbi:MAG: PEP-CTERM sorting domain-containing protein [Phycisphaerales bacterium]|nr:PEP-CTERM sorting domain-containing protein [Phycisphaerales bacterium]
MAALFEIVLGQGETDAKIDVGENLNLELWLTLSSSEPIPNLRGVSFFLDLTASENSIIWFNQNYVDDLFPGSTISNPPADNTPVTGEFSRQSFSVSGLAVQNQTPIRIGRFSVQGLSPGTVSYSFGDDGLFREWMVALQVAKPIIYLPTLGNPAFSITVVPEPGSIVGMLVMLLFVHRRQWTPNTRRPFDN